ncbi:hypothetical protein CHARACLAT_026770 [Characodon lateralis]|uniref:Uncharacterized protein n=1 Tax=Characodon lateralis TaxID=208331 RepID=A0ABU7D3W1_9TELE|nr:hypothetical protein [Characodon lateralis]
MNKDSSLSLPRWTTQVGSLLNSSLLGSPFKNPVHPPSTAPTSETPGPTYHPGTPLSTIICLTGKNNHLASPLSSLWIIPSTHWYPGSSFPVHYTAL